ncbi:MAG: hypothetical protein JEY91_03930 [Spirochaetaceae bacterium]|nr:hypothetical protein [Spirochaetaceae bacterium]
MIGVQSSDKFKETVIEFFELFKTPWEFYTENTFYDVIITTGGFPEKMNGKLIIIYNSKKLPFDSETGIIVKPSTEQKLIIWRGMTCPIYSDLSLFGVENSHDSTFIVKDRKTEYTIIRISYDVFSEIHSLLTSGQTIQYAGIPSLEIHIDILRTLIIQENILLIEVPPTPYGYEYMTCLTHDIDFAGIRQHVFDHTLFGFIYRATWLTLCDFFRGKCKIGKLWKNIIAVLKLPAIFLGVCKDFWLGFDLYGEIEQDLKSTYFFLPFKGESGQSQNGYDNKKRAGKYEIRDLRTHIKKIIHEKNEIGLHGIDAWYNSEKGLQESKKISEITGQKIEGTRIHWLYYNLQSPHHISNAGLEYDSTLGYNNSVGFYNGSTQVFTPLETDNFFEIPLMIQDTALFYPSRMNLNAEEAFQMCQKIIAQVKKFGGVLTVNWHGRSLAPERLWNDFYRQLLNYIQTDLVWFGTCKEIITWYKKRRSVEFKSIEIIENRIVAQIDGINHWGGPGLSLNIYGLGNNDEKKHHFGSAFQQFDLQKNMTLKIPI